MEQWKMIEPIPGDHIRVESNGYYHHGIYASDDCVIHFAPAGNCEQFKAEQGSASVPLDLVKCVFFLFFRLPHTPQN